MEGEDEESDSPRAFSKAKVWQRMIIVVAGAFMNVLLGIVLMCILVVQEPYYASTTIESFHENSRSATQGLQVGLHVGADADMTNKITVDIDAMNAAGLGVKGINVSDTNGASATYAIDAIADAVAKVSAQRSALGAIQNRLEHTIANLDNVVENTTAAESRIRDTDMAEEMVEFSKNNILAQAGQSMLAQANTSTQGVLALLR